MPTYTIELKRGVLANRPATGGTGEPFFATDTKQFFIYDGTQWNQIAGSGGSAVSSVFTRTGAVVATSGDYSVGQITGAAPLASPTFTGTPTAPTPLTANNSTAIATTAFVKAQGYITSSPVSSVFTRTGAVVATSGDYTVSQITGAAPLASPTFTGTPAAPTPLTADNSTTLATTAFVKAQGYITSSAVTTVFGRAGVVVATSGDYTVSQITGAAPLASPTFTGTPAAPTPLTADNSTTIATTAFVKAQGYLTSNAVTSVFGRVGVVVAATNDYTVSQVTGAAPLASPVLTGTPLAPTATAGTNTTQIATTAFVTTAVSGGGGAVSSVFGRTGVVVSATNDYSFAQISGTAASGQLPTPTTGAIGGVKAVSAVSHQWVNSIDTTGTPQLSQPAFSDVSGVATIAQVPSRLLNFQKQTAVITPASNTETAIYSYTIPANTFQLGSGIRISCVIAHTTGATSTNYKCEFGGSGTLSLQSGATGGQLAQWNLVIMQDAVSANTQYITRLQSSNAAGVIVVPLAPVTATETTSGAITVQITVAATGGADSYTGYLFIVEQLI